MPATVHAMFAVPFSTAVHPAADALNAELRKLILDLETTAESQRNPAPVMHIPAGLYESDFTFFARKERAVQQLRDFCWASLGELIQALTGRSAAQMAQMRILSHTWFHVTRDGGWFGHHNHPMASWSGVYCVDDGRPNPAVPENGVLTFPNPLQAANVFLDPGNVPMEPPYSHGNYAQRLQPGQLVMFPSWLSHFVTPYRGDGTRITVAFNCWFSQATG
ncbi:hypothetical protein GCM10007067_14220 [Lysobacter bugurensis]|uniref:2OG-Fe(II) oxygenase n=2 Tax=Cognatilysobacter bugurensis TaxID=543356 RepID=A0A918W7L9_9GAMM|nr:hypothetical protein GCM10007067_14220 [Lysobacter bugurensis]